MTPTPNPVPQIGAPLIDPNTGNTNVQWWKFWSSIPKALYNVLFSTNGIANPTQSALNLVAGQNVTLTQDQVGGVAISAGPKLENNGVANGSQTQLNLVAGANVTLTDDGTGDITVTASGAGGGVNARTAAYTLVAGDNGKNVVFGIPGAVTATLPSPPPNAGWTATISNELNSSANLTITSTPNIDGTTGTNAMVLCPGQSVQIWASAAATAYLTSRGGPLAGQIIKGAPAGGQPVLTLTATGSGNALSLIGGTTAYALSIINTAGTGCVYANSTNGFAGYFIASGYGSGLYAQSGASWGALFANNSAGYATIFTNNLGGGSNLHIGQYIDFFVGYSVSTLPTPSSGQGAVIYANDAKNLVDDLAVVGSVAVGGGHGALCCYVNGSWRTLC